MSHRKFQVCFTLSPISRSFSNNGYQKIKEVDKRFDFEHHNGSFAHLVVRMYVDFFMLAIKNDNHDDGDLYVLEEVYGMVLN